MRKQGEITVFLSLIIVCVLSLFMGLLESARTAGARLYAQVAADSAMDSVMSQYNRNLWEMYHLLFLEAESDEAMEESFSEYLEFYFGQENLYPMKLDDVKVTGTGRLMDDGGALLEDGALSYVTYRMPEVAEDLIGISEDAANAAKAGDFRQLFEVCRQAGRKTRKLEKSREKVEENLSEAREIYEELTEAAGAESKGRFESRAEALQREIRKFSGLVDAYETELQNLSEHRAELEMADVKETETMSQELLAYEQMETAAKTQLLKYREMESVLEENLGYLDEALGLLEEERYEYVYVEHDEVGNPGSEEDGLGGAGSSEVGDSEGGESTDGYVEAIPLGPDWAAIGDCISQIQIPGADEKSSIDREKASMIDRLEELFQGDLLGLVLPEGAEVSGKSVSLRGIPSDQVEKNDGASIFSENDVDAARKFLVNEYCFLSFDSFMERCSGKVALGNQPLRYELEYLLCGEASDRENLAGAVERLLTVRGAMNLLCLLSSPEKQAEADTMALAVSGGNAPVKFILSFFILTLWAFGEAVRDVKCLLNGGRVPFWKNDGQWKTELEELLSLQFLESEPQNEENGRDYADHMRVLFFLIDRETRNFRMMDVIQWNVRTIQEDFAVADCVGEVEVETKIHEQHLFLVHDGYLRTVETAGAY